MKVPRCHASKTPTELMQYPGETLSFLGSNAHPCREDPLGRVIDWLVCHTTTRWVSPARADALPASPASPAPAPHF